MPSWLHANCWMCYCTIRIASPSHHQYLCITQCDHCPKFLSIELEKFSSSDSLVMHTTLVNMEWLVDFFELDGSKFEGNGWWVLMLGGFMEESMGSFNFDFLEPMELLVLHCFAPGLFDLLFTVPPCSTHPPLLGQLPTTRCATILCDVTIVNIGHFYFFCIMPATRQRLCISLHFKIMRAFW